MIMTPDCTDRKFYLGNVIKYFIFLIEIFIINLMRQSIL
jgi:hypothetical protein